jgi:prophage antirepressor-like protein
MSLGTLIVDIFENIIKINNTNILIILDKNKNIWFSLGHLFKALEYKNIRAEIKRVQVEDKEIITLQDLMKNVDDANKIDYTNDVQPHMKMISECGVFIILDKSEKPIAVEIRKLLNKDVLPSLRKNGKYEVSKEDKKKIKSLKVKINKIVKMTKIHNKTNTKYIDVTTKGFIYVLKVKALQDGTEKQCYKIGYTANLNKRLKTYKTGNPDVELVHQENVNCNKKQLEQCVLNLNILKKLSSKNEIICNSSLKEIKEELDDCKKLIAKHV